MIDAQAVLAHLTALGELATAEPGAKDLAESDWLQNELRQIALEHQRDARGNYWITLPGKSERSVVLGSYLGANGSDHHIGIVSGLETIKAVSRREDGRPPCTLQVVVWAEPRDPEPGHSIIESSALLPEKVAAYLELHMEPETDPGQAGATAVPAIVPAFNPRLRALRDEAVRELTGAPAPLPSEASEGTTEIVKGGVPTAVMYVQAPGGVDDKTSTATRLHLLQAAEAFGRWAESAMHLVAGEEVDLWAREHRVPRS